MDREPKAAAQGISRTGTLPGTVPVPDAAPRAPEKTPAVVVPSLRVAFSWTLAGNLIYYGCEELPSEGVAQVADTMRR